MPTSSGGCRRSRPSAWPAPSAPTNTLRNVPLPDAEADAAGEPPIPAPPARPGPLPVAARRAAAALPPGRLTHLPHDIGPSLVSGDLGPLAPRSAPRPAG